MFYAFKDYSNGLWEVLGDDGSRFKYPFYNDKKAKEFLAQWYPEIEFVQRHWEHPRVISAKLVYENVTGFPFDGRCDERSEI